MSEPLELMAATWAAENVHFFSPQCHNASEEAYVLNSINELSFLLDLHVSVRGELSPPYDVLYEHIRACVNTVSYRRQWMRTRTNFLDFALAPLTVSRLGGLNSEMAWTLDRMSRSLPDVMSALPPWAQLFQFWIMRRLGIGILSSILDATFQGSIPVRETDLLHPSKDEAYAMTHAVFFVTEYGQRSPRWASGRQEARVIKSMSAMLRLCCAEKDPDLVAEFLAALACLGVTSNYAIDRSWSFLLETYGLNQSACEENAVEQTGLRVDSSEAWKDQYHPIILAGVASMLSQAVSEGYPLVPLQFASRPAIPATGKSSEWPMVAEAAKAIDRWLNNQLDTSNLNVVMGALSGMSYRLEEQWPRAQTWPTPVEAAVARVVVRLDTCTPQLDWTELGGDTLLRAACVLNASGVRSSSVFEEVKRLVESLEPTVFSQVDSAMEYARILNIMGYVVPSADVADEDNPIDPLSDKIIRMTESGDYHATITAAQLVAMHGRYGHLNHISKLTTDRLLATFEPLSVRYGKQWWSDFKVSSAVAFTVLLRSILWLQGPEAPIVRQAIRYIFGWQDRSGVFLSLAEHSPLKHMSGTVAIRRFLSDIIVARHKRGKKKRCR